MKVALYPGTFDPITLGHLDVIKQTSAVFDKVIVGLLINTSKKPLFTEDERKMMIVEAVADAGIANVEVKVFSGLAVELARREKAAVIIRGLRLTTEYENELNIIFNNRILDPNIIPILIPPQQEHIHISSTIVRELLNFGHSDLDKYVPPAVLEHIKVMKKRAEEKVREKFFELCRRLGASEACASFVFNQLIVNYGSSHRFYHTICHILGCLDEFEEVKPVLHDPDAVEMAIFFHDIVYDTHAKDNEEKSAELAVTMMKMLNLHQSFRECVARLILATKHDIPPDNFDAQTLADIDLAPLGCSEREFDKNMAKIRKEYEWVPDEKFREGRVAFLKSLLPPNRHNIYRTQFFRVKYEEKARQNLTRAIAQLSK